MRVAYDKGAFPIGRAYSLDAGYDIRTPRTAYLEAHGSTTIDTGVHVEIPAGYVGFLKSKSGLNVKHDLTGEGVVDSGYTGSIRVKLYNNGSTPYSFESGDKIIQLVILPILTPELEVVTLGEFEESERSGGGFGSTGR